MTDNEELGSSFFGRSRELREVEAGQVTHQIQVLAHGLDEAVSVRESERFREVDGDDFFHQLKLGNNNQHLITNKLEYSNKWHF